MRGGMAALGREEGWCRGRRNRTFLRYAMSGGLKLASPAAPELSSKISAHDREKCLGDHGEAHQRKEQICHPEAERWSGVGDAAPDVVEGYT